VSAYRSDYVRSERVRGFQPPWYTVDVLQCRSCAREYRLRVRGSGLGPGGIRCDCGGVVRF